MRVCMCETTSFPQKRKQVIWRHLTLRTTWFDVKKKSLKSFHMFFNWCNYYNFILNPLFPLCAYNIYDVVIECQRPQSNKIFVYISPVLH